MNIPSLHASYSKNVVNIADVIEHLRCWKVAKVPYHKTVLEAHEVSYLSKHFRDAGYAVYREYGLIGPGGRKRADIALMRSDGIPACVVQVHTGYPADREIAEDRGPFMDPDGYPIPVISYIITRGKGRCEVITDTDRYQWTLQHDVLPESIGGPPSGYEVQSWLHHIIQDGSPAVCMPGWNGHDKESRILKSSYQAMSECDMMERIGNRMVHHGCLPWYEHLIDNRHRADIAVLGSPDWWMEGKIHADWWASVFTKSNTRNHKIHEIHKEMRRAAQHGARLTGWFVECIGHPGVTDTTAKRVAKDHAISFASMARSTIPPGAPRQEWIHIVVRYEQSVNGLWKWSSPLESHIHIIDNEASR
jgi:hypothetical protein